MSESEDYNAESEDYKIRGGETPITGDDVTGEEGEISVTIPEARYPAGKKTTAKDADLVAGNIKSGVTIFDKLGTHAPLTGDNVTGAEGQKVISIPAANYPAGKTATAQDADLTAANIKKDIVIFGVTGTLEAATVHEGIFYPKVGADDGTLIGTGYAAGNTYLGIGKDGGGTSRNCHIRFPGVPIPAGATIIEALIRMTSNFAGNATVVNVNCYFNDADDAVAPTSTAEWNALALTAAIAWNAIAAWTDGGKYDTPELKTILQDVIDRGGWATGQAIMLLLKDNNSDSAALRGGSAYEYNSASEIAELRVKWTE